MSRQEIWSPVKKVVKIKSIPPVRPFLKGLF